MSTDSPVEAPFYTVEEVIASAAVFTLMPSNVRWVDVRLYNERRDEQLQAEYDAAWNERQQKRKRRR